MSAKPQMSAPTMGMPHMLVLMMPAAHTMNTCCYQQALPRVCVCHLLFWSVCGVAKMTMAAGNTYHIVGSNQCVQEDSAVFHGHTVLQPVVLLSRSGACWRALSMEADSMTCMGPSPAVQQPHCHKQLSVGLHGCQV
jgi:hypothetical protein